MASFHAGHEKSSLHAGNVKMNFHSGHEHHVFHGRNKNVLSSIPGVPVLPRSRDITPILSINHSIFPELTRAGNELSSFWEGQALRISKDAHRKRIWLPQQRFS